MGRIVNWVRVSIVITVEAALKVVMCQMVMTRPARCAAHQSASTLIGTCGDIGVAAAAQTVADPRDQPDVGANRELQQAWMADLTR
jgi:hypothetical protein